MAVCEFHPEHGVRQRFDYRALDFDRFFLRRRALRRFLGFSARAVWAALSCAIDGTADIPVLTVKGTPEMRSQGREAG